MKKEIAYHKHAEECRALAKRMESGNQRDQLLKMAETWEVLAQERARILRQQTEEPAAPRDAGEPKRAK